MRSTITRSLAFGLITVVAAFANSIAMAAPTPQGLKADGLRWQAMADAYQHQQDLSHYTKQGLRADGLRWQAMAQRYKWLKNHRGENGSASASPPPEVSAISSGAGFDWGDAGIGAASGFALAVGASALVLATRRTRRTNVAA
jgi:hypothetical protein